MFDKFKCVCTKVILFSISAKTRIAPKNSKNNNKQEYEADLILHKADEEADEVHVKSEPEAEIQTRI